jgi:hypothetical protein
MRPIDTAPLFSPLYAELITLLRSLTPAQWLLPTVAGRWRVRDVAGHLLDVGLRRIAVGRDGHLPSPDGPVATPQDVALLVNALNAGGVAFSQRLSTRQLVDLDITGSWVSALVRALPPEGRAVFAVSWAGESTSENWMDIGREYTEQWHHQMQIRDAVGAPLLLAPRWVDPLLNICVRALPVAYASTQADEGTAIAVQVELDGDPTREWTIVRSDGRWMVDEGARSTAHCRIRTSADVAWRLLFNALPAHAARGALSMSGDLRLAEPFLHARSVVL